MNSTAYLIIFESGQYTRKDLQKLLDGMDEVSHWYSCFPNAVFIASTMSAENISTTIRKRFKSEGVRFIVTEVPSNSQGWLPKDAWDLVQNPESV